ncbi:MAG: hypothetical protein JWR77_89 [Rhizorhabdus sp.]|nr:hypothetical protein [Rhizorhabdus sp.]
MAEPPIQTAVDDVHAHAHKTGHKWVDLVIALSAITISVISFFVAVEHGRIEEKLVAASSWPFLTFETEKNGLETGGWTIYLRLKNSGVGPARVKWMRLNLDGHQIRDRGDLMSRCCGVPVGTNEAQIPLGLFSENAPVGILPARDSVEVLTWRARPGNDAIMARLDGVRHRLRTEACYCSVLDECWISDLTATAEPRRVDRCEPVSDGYVG